MPVIFLPGARFVALTNRTPNYILARTEVAHSKVDKGQIPATARNFPRYGGLPGSMGPD
jgi:hypothetical protein